VPRTTTTLERQLALRDLTDPAEGPHALQLLVDLAARALARQMGCELRLVRGSRVVTVEENYDRLGFAPEAVTRDARYTRYVDATHMLRSHSSAIVPGALEELARRPAPGVLLVCPGICFRRDSIDRLRVSAPHQLDLWRISAVSRLGEEDLEQMIAVLCRTLIPGRPWRTEPRQHPYTLSGRQVDVNWDGEWVEIAECGLAHPDVLARAGLGPHVSGLALGMGLDRLLMLVKGIPDIRLLRVADERVAGQMLDFEPYRPVSSMPPIRRDLSVAVDEDDLAEDLGDRVREALGDDAELVEEIAVLSSTPADELPAAAAERLGIAPGQVNLLVRVTLRSLERSLEDAEANLLRDRVFGALHRGRRAMWAAGRPDGEPAQGGAPRGRHVI